MNIRLFQSALEAAKHIIDHNIDMVSYVVSSDAPETYHEMVEFYESTGYFCIYDGGGESIWGSDYNVKFRAIHDAMHYHTGLTFSLKDEKVLSEYSAIEFMNQARKLGYSTEVSQAVYELINAEIKGQIEYYESNGDFLLDQVTYIKRYLQVG